MTRRPIAEMTVREFTEALASDAPTPGGGTGAAAAGAMGAALVAMFARLTVGRPKFAAHDALLRAVADGAAEAAARLLALAEEDAAAYDAVSAAYRLPKGSDAEQASRKAAVQAALKGACVVPLKVMEECLEVIGLAKTSVPVGNPNAASDGAAGAELAKAAMTVASYNVRINLASIEDPAFQKETRTRLDEIVYMGGASAAEISSQVLDRWKPKPKPTLPLPTPNPHPPGGR
jgi:formiminotetrahydrofolate cyclodeaminase